MFSYPDLTSIENSHRAPREVKRVGKICEARGSGPLSLQEPGSLRSKFNHVHSNVCTIFATTLYRWDVIISMNSMAPYVVPVCDSLSLVQVLM